MSPMKPATNALAGLVVDHLRPVELLDAPARHHGDAIAHRHRLLLVVRDVHEREVELALHALELDLHLAAQLEVERAERLVEQQHARPQHERARQRDALLLPAGELARPPIGDSRAAARARAPPRRGAVARLRATLALLEAVGHVLEHRHVREQRVVLEDGVDAAPVGRDADRVDAADQDRALGRLLEAGEQAQRGRLAAARRAEQREELAAAHGEIDAVDRRDRAEALDDADQLGVELRACGLGRHRVAARALRRP